MKILPNALSGSPWWATDSPAAAIRDFLAEHEEFEVDTYYNRLGVTYCQGGFLRRR
jgi:cephalosporin hydroxylase